MSQHPVIQYHGYAAGRLFHNIGVVAENDLASKVTNLRPLGRSKFLGDFGVLVYPPSGIAQQSHCTPALLSIVMLFGHCTDHCTTGSVAGGA